jgi:hypothetical protein
MQLNFFLPTFTLQCDTFPNVVHVKAVSHVKAKNVSVELVVGSDYRSGDATRQQTVLRPRLRSGGKGTRGFRLTTTTERVKSLGGFCMIESSWNEDAIIPIEIPACRKRAARVRLEIVGGMS